MSKSEAYFSNKRVVVTGGAGFLGSHVVEQLESLGADVFVPRSSEFDLRLPSECVAMLEKFEPQVVIHCAVDGGGIAYMREKPAEITTNNVLLNTNLLHSSWAHGVEKFVGVSSVCAYPREAAIPMREPELFMGYPEPSNAGYGLTKRMMMEQGRAYHQQHGFSAVFPMPVNLYGPRDDFHSERSHVVPALIRKCVAAVRDGADALEVWGSGQATRELLYVEDCADAIVEMASQIDHPEPINIGTGVETSIRELAQAVADACGFSGELRFDATKPDGQPRKCLDVSRAEQQFGWSSKVSLSDGLLRSVEWYLSQ